MADWEDLYQTWSEKIDELIDVKGLFPYPIKEPKPEHGIGFVWGKEVHVTSTLFPDASYRGDFRIFDRPGFPRPKDWAGNIERWWTNPTLGQIKAFAA